MGPSRDGSIRSFFGDVNPVSELFAFLPADEDAQAVMRETGLLPWWSAEGVRANFYRPLAALTHLVDFWLWTDQAFMHHLHSFLWLVMATWSVRRVVPVFSGLRGGALSLAILFFIVEDAHAIAVGWSRIEMFS